MSFYYSTGIISVENIQFTFDVTSFSDRLTWSPPFKNYPLSYHIYIENQHGQLLYNDITDDTSYELYNLTVCDIYTATVIAHSREYSSSNVTIQEEFSGGMFLFNAHLSLPVITDYYVMILPDYEVIFNEPNNSFDIQFQVIVS